MARHGWRWSQWGEMLDGATVLLVQDDPAIVEVVRLGLSYEGAEVVVAPDGPRAVRAQYDARPDLVLLDLGLPGLDGLDVLQRIRAQRVTPVIILTARDGPEQRVLGLEAGADDYVTNPSGAVVSKRSAARLTLARSAITSSTTPSRSSGTIARLSAVSPTAKRSK